jgi:hypothetical protein
MAVEGQSLEVGEASGRDRADHGLIGGQVDLAGGWIVLQIFGIISDLGRIQGFILVVLVIGDAHVAFAFGDILADALGGLGAGAAALRADIVGVYFGGGQKGNRRQRGGDARGGAQRVEERAAVRTNLLFLLLQ